MLPLSGLRILDLSRVLAGPFCAQILADLGADVIKIESPEGDETRSWGPPYFDKDSAYFLSANRNKRITHCDFKNAKDLERVHVLLETADVLIENFKVDGLKKFGLDYDALSKRYPRLIYASITGFGQSGPYAHRSGYDLMIQALSGLMSITGPDASHPTKVGVATSDLSTGLYCAIGILAALRERDRSGLGQHLDLAIYDCQISLLANVAMNYLVSQKIPGPMGNQHPSIAPYEVFETSDARFIAIAIGNDRQFASLCQTLGSLWQTDARFLNNPLRVQNRSALSQLLKDEIKKKPLEDWLELFSKANFPFGPVQNLEEVAKNPQTQTRKIFTTLEDGRTPTLRPAIRWSRCVEAPMKKPTLQSLENLDWL